MRKLKGYGWLRSRRVLWITAALAVLTAVLLYKLGDLTGGLSAGEMQAAAEPIGWHGIFHAPLDLPLKLVRSAVFVLSPDHGQILTRLPNVFFGVLTVISFSWLIWLWHGRRTAIMTTLLFAGSAWTLHVSRLASYDVLYFSAIPLLLLVQALLYRNSGKRAVWYGSIVVWGMLLYVPGLVWLVLLHTYLQRKIISEFWKQQASPRRKLISLTLGAVWLPLLIVNLFRSGQFMQWLGLPSQMDGIAAVGKHFIGVFVHLFIRGPKYPDQWLGRAPVLDIFTLVICLLGIYFYATHWKAWRSRTLGLMFGLGVILVTLGGPVSLSLLVPLLYIAAAAGLAYLLHEWLQVFPINPLARGVGIGLMSVLVALSCLYNLRSYFIAWPHNADTKTIFRYHR